MINIVYLMAVLGAILIGMMIYYEVDNKNKY